ncbi:MAG: hypothetical protein EBS19_05445, partial [Spirochaetia bacterium]|nr:hypothetical protein [Spirochaetia bacterium]
MDVPYQIEDFKNDGVLVIKNFFNPSKIVEVRKNAESVFERQFNHFGYEGTFREKIQNLFDNNFDVFVNCGKTIQQGLFELYE